MSVSGRLAVDKETQPMSCHSI